MKPKKRAKKAAKTILSEMNKLAIEYNNLQNLYQSNLYVTQKLDRQLIELNRRVTILESELNLLRHTKKSFK